MTDREEKNLTTREECERELKRSGRKPIPKSKRVGLTKLTTEFLELALILPENHDKLAQYKQRENEAEMRGYFKAQETLRELIVLGGTDAIQDLAEVRNPKQWRPTYMEGLGRVWFS